MVMSGVPAARRRPPAYREHFQGYPLNTLPISAAAPAGAPPASQQTQHGSAAPTPARRQYPHPAHIHAVLAASTLYSASTLYTGNLSSGGFPPHHHALETLPASIGAPAGVPPASRQTSEAQPPQIQPEVKVKARQRRRACVFFPGGSAERGGHGAAGRIENQRPSARHARSAGECVCVCLRPVAEGARWAAEQFSGGPGDLVVPVRPAPGELEEGSYQRSRHAGAHLPPRVIVG